MGRCGWKDRGEKGEVQGGCSACAPGSSFLSEDVHGGGLGKESIKKDEYRIQEESWKPVAIRGKGNVMGGSLKSLRSTAAAPQHWCKSDVPGWCGRDPRGNSLARVEKRNRLGSSGRRARGVWQKSRESCVSCTPSVLGIK